MSTLAIDRSTKTTAIAIVEGGSAREANFGVWDGVSPLELDCSIDRIVVGIGPGSFAGIRSSLAWAQGYAIGSGCKVEGIVSPAAFAEEGLAKAVVGDARRGKFWIALFDGFKLVCDIFQVEREQLAKRIPRGANVVSPDDERIGAILKEELGESYAPAPVLSATALAAAFIANPSLLIAEPLPLYLNPAVR